MSCPHQLARTFGYPALLVYTCLQTIQVILDGLANVLKIAGPDVEVITTQIEEAGGLEKIEDLQHHKNQDIYDLAYKIIDKYFTTGVSILIVGSGR